MHQRTWLTLVTFPIVATFTLPVIVRKSPPAARSAEAPASQDPLAGLSDIQDVLVLIRDNYVDAPDLEKVIGGGIQAALERAHPLNAYLSAEDLRLPDPGPAGIGIRVIKRGIYGYILGVVPGSPAAKAGFQVGDVIRKLDGESVGPLSAWTLERRLLGHAGSEITLLRYATGSGDLKKVVLKRELPARVAVTVRKEARASVLALPDLAPGRAAELSTLLPGLDHALPLVLDLRACQGGTLEETAKVAGLFVGAGPLVTIEETGKAPLTLAVQPQGVPPFAKVALLLGVGTVGPAEALASTLKKQSCPTFGDRTAALGVERTRFSLRQGGAVELVNKRWIGAGGEKLGLGGEKGDRQNGQVPTYGVAPEHPLKGLKAEEDPLPRILEVLDAGPAKTTQAPVPRTGVKEAFLHRDFRLPATLQETT